jgi:hypothetical protein
MTSATRSRRRRPRPAAARQALRLCEAELVWLTSDRAGMSQSSQGIHRGQPRISVVMTRKALRAAGVPPPIAAALRRRLRLIPGQEADQ